MKYVKRAILALVGCVIVGSVVFFAMLLVSAHAGDLYNSRVKIAFNAASVNYAAGDPARTVVVTMDSASRELDPDAYREMSFYLREGATKAFWPRGTGGAHISVAICGTDRAEVYRLSADRAYVAFTTSGETMKMVIRGDGLWNQLLSVASRAAEE